MEVPTVQAAEFYTTQEPGYYTRLSVNDDGVIYVKWQTNSLHTRDDLFSDYQGLDLSTPQRTIAHGTLTPLSPPPGYSIVSIADEGLMAGNIDATSSFIYDGSTYTTFSIALPTVYSEAVDGMNNHGDVAGSLQDAGSEHGFVRLANGQLEIFDAPGASGTWVNDVNDLGQLVGYYKDASGAHGFFYDGTTWTTLDAAHSNPVAVNNWGQIIANNELFSGSVGFGAPIWVPVKTSLLAETGTGGFTISAQDINNRGEIVGALAITLGGSAAIVANHKDASQAWTDFYGVGTSSIFMHDAQTGTMREWIMQEGLISYAPSPGVASADRQLIGVGDFNGDGRSDVLWQDSSTHELGQWLMVNGQVWKAPSDGGVSPDYQVLGGGDFNGDGISDVLWRHTPDGAVGAWLFNGSDPQTGLPYISAKAQSGAMAANWKLLGVGDFNGDGISDVAWRDPGTGAVSEWLMGHQGQRVTAVSPGTIAGGDDLQAAVADLNGDGISDIVWRDPATDSLNAWLGREGQPPSLIMYGHTSHDLVTAADYTGDGLADVLWRDPVSGGVGYFAMNGNAFISHSVELGGLASNWLVLHN